MDANDLATIGNAIPAKDGGNWLPEHRDIALDVWLFVAGRSVSRCASILAGPAYGMPVPERTLRDWVRRYSWDAEADNRLASIAPALRLRRGLTIDAASLDVSYQLARIASGDTPASVAELVAAARVILDAAGVTGLGARDRATNGAVRSAAPALPKLTDTERAALTDRLSRLGQSA
jgi:hypothetical protein